MRTIVLQSHAEDVPAWQRTCLESVRAWASTRGYERRVEGDELFARVPRALGAKLADRPMVRADLARLAWIAEVNAEGARAIWLDADVLVFAPDAFTLPDEDALFGAEVWVQREARGFRAYRRVHNALLAFAPQSPLLPFLRWGSERLLQRYRGTPPPHVVGPRLLSALHNLFDFPQHDRVGSLGPHVLRDLIDGASDDAAAGDALALFRRKAPAPLVAANLCASLQPDGYEGERLSDEEMRAACQALLRGAGRQLASRGRADQAEES